MGQRPRKKQKLKTASSLPIDAVSSLPRSPRKRAFSETALSSNDEHSRILRECSPNKKIKIVAESQNSAMNGMMVDEEEEAEAVENGKRSISIEHKADLDDEGDVSMESATKIETANANANETQPITDESTKRRPRKVTMGAVDAMSYRRPSKRRNRQQFPPNRVRRSGVEFLVQCGVGA